MKRSTKTLIVSLLIPLAAGGLAALISGGGMKDFAMYEKPPFSPPGWLFPVVWTVLYILMGIASYLVLSSGAPEKQIKTALIVYGMQLFLNFIWPIAFFGAGNTTAGAVIAVALLILVAATTVLFYGIKREAGLLFLPYLVWCIFALYLNIGIVLLN